MNILRQSILTAFIIAGGLISYAPHSAAQTPDAEEKAKILDDARARLDGSIWTLKVTSAQGPKEKRKSTEDTLTLDGSKLHTENLADEGYEDSNITLTVSDNGAVVFETMQRSAKGGVVFWRGELEGERIKGVISKQVPEKDPQSYSFYGEQSGTLEEEPAVVEDIQPEAGLDEAAEAGPAEQPAAEKSE